MEDTTKETNAYKKIIWHFIDAIKTEKQIVPISYHFLSAQMFADTKKVEAFIKDHGEVITQDGQEGVRMSMEHGLVVEKMISNLDNTVLAFEMVGSNAVIGMVCKYDGYLGELTKQLFIDKPEMLNGSEKEFRISDILSYSDIEELKEALIEKEIETLLRKNHIEQLQWLEGKLKMDLRKFRLLPNFVEIMERRNLLVHSNGVVSRQYISECNKYGVIIPEDVGPGKVLKTEPDYVNEAFSVLLQVGVMLGFVLWYKMRPKEGESILDALSEASYNLINDGDYSLAYDLIDFSLSNRVWEKDINNAQRLVFQLNMALSFHLRDRQDECERMVKSLDMTAAEPVYHLASAVLLNDYDKAYQMMNKIGKDDQMRVFYKTWPLFKRIRKETGFVDMFKAIYDEEYECNSACISDIEDVISSALELVDRAKKMDGSTVDEVRVENQ